MGAELCRNDLPGLGYAPKNDEMGNPMLPKWFTEKGPSNEVFKGNGGGGYGSIGGSQYESSGHRGAHTPGRGGGPRGGGPPLNLYGPGSSPVGPYQKPNDLRNVELNNNDVGVNGNSGGQNVNGNRGGGTNGNGAGSNQGMGMSASAVTANSFDWIETKLLQASARVELESEGAILPNSGEGVAGHGMILASLLDTGA